MKVKTPFMVVFFVKYKLITNYWSFKGRFLLNSNASFFFKFKARPPYLSMIAIKFTKKKSNSKMYKSASWYWICITSRKSCHTKVFINWFLIRVYWQLVGNKNMCIVKAGIWCHSLKTHHDMPFTVWCNTTCMTNRATIAPVCRGYCVRIFLISRISVGVTMPQCTRKGEWLGCLSPARENNSGQTA